MLTELLTTLSHTVRMHKVLAWNSASSAILLKEQLHSKLHSTQHHSWEVLSSQQHNSRVWQQLKFLQLHKLQVHQLHKLQRINTLSP